MTPAEILKPPYALAPAARQEKRKALVSTIADWSSRREVVFQTSTERAKSAYVLAPAARQRKAEVARLAR
ncbi:hypothetical protein [Pseudobacillus wudalianchiensis]|uniref:Uncharacterized protein n=1 Tax=Pseudobacillus wudalianchiensis TaxID=1743143 RepID=A0A1B9AYH0_9BACI|nr:hypothetical protein [Bacillus wudalianchiensis]OCA88850.1 hypothetical protein A8F95_05275 [Bacillus wudalianchiensis]